MHIILVAFCCVQVVFSESFWGVYRKNEYFTSQSTCSTGYDNNDAILFASVTSEVECLGLCSRFDTCAGIDFDVSTGLCVPKRDSSACSVADENVKARQKVN